MPIPITMYNETMFKGLSVSERTYVLYQMLTQMNAVPPTAIPSASDTPTDTPPAPPVEGTT